MQTKSVLAGAAWLGLSAALVAGALPAGAQTPQTNIGRYCRNWEDAGGRRVSVTNSGNVITLQMPGGSLRRENLFCGNAIEGYVVCYATSATGAEQIAYNVHDSSLNFQLNRLNGRCVGTASGLYPNNRELFVQVDVFTTDGNIQITRIIRWRTGQDFIRVRTIVRNNRTSGDIFIRSVKHVADTGFGRLPTNNCDLAQDYDAFDNVAITGDFPDSKFLMIADATAGFARQAYWSPFNPGPTLAPEWARCDATLGSTALTFDVDGLLVNRWVPIPPAPMAPNPAQLGPGQQRNFQSFYAVDP